MLKTTAAVLAAGFAAGTRAVRSQVDVSMNGIELQDREFVAAMRERRTPRASVADVLPCYQWLDRMEKQLDAA